MADIKNVFKFKNDFQITNLINKLNLDPMQLCDFMQIIAEGYDLNETRENVLDYVAKTDFDSYVYVRKLLTEEEVPQEVNLNELLELKDLIEEISRKMSASLHTKLLDLFTKKATINIANIFFTLCKDYETDKDINIDLTLSVDGKNVAYAIYNLKNDIKTIADAEKEENKSVQECFKLPESRKRINKTSFEGLQALKEEYLNSLYATNDDSYQELLYETNLKLNTYKMMKSNKLFESINNHKRTSLWINNIGQVILEPVKESWDLIHYNHTISNIPTPRLISFIKQLNEVEDPKEEKKKYTDVMPDFVMDVQDMVDPDQKHLGIKQIEEVSKDLEDEEPSLSYDLENNPLCAWCGDRFPKSEMKKEKKFGWLCNHCARGLESREGKLDFDDELEEDTCAAGIATISKPLFKKESKKLKEIKENLNKLDEYRFTLNNKVIDYSSLDGIQVFVEGVIANVHTKEDAIKLFEMIDRNEDISNYLFEGLNIEDIRFLLEDGDISNGISSPENPDEYEPDVNPEYHKKKEELNNMADTGNSNISVNIDTNNTGIKTASDDYDILGLEDNDEAGKASSALVKNRNTGETITVDPHDINIKA